MKVIDIPIKQVDLNQFMKRLANESDCKNLINFDCLITSNGVPKILYLKLPKKINTDFIRQACKNIKYTNVERISSGLITQGKNRTFGLRPRRAMSKNAFTCSATSLATESPLEHGVFINFLKQLMPFYEKYFSKEYHENIKTVEEKTIKQWRIDGTPFTSGIVNYNSELQYHYDIGHFHGAMSIMLTLKGGVSGGGLCFPELDTRFDLADNTILLMDGQELMHGVPKLNKLATNGYRYTIVYYSLLQMWKCLPINEEIIAMRAMRAIRERNRANGANGKMNTDLKKNGKMFSEKLTLSLAKKINKKK